MFAIRYLDVIVAVVAAIVAIALGAPALGCALGAGGWLLQRGVQAVDRRWAQQMSSPRAALGVSLFERFGRIWLLAGAIVIAGVVGARKDGLAAALIIFCAYSIRFVISLVSGPPGADDAPPASSSSNPSSTTRSES
jgi:TRAP-type C4-dicarboxylate transport system permease small subunit